MLRITCGGGATKKSELTADSAKNIEGQTLLNCFIICGLPSLEELFSERSGFLRCRPRSQLVPGRSGCDTSPQSRHTLDTVAFTSEAVLRSPM